MSQRFVSDASHDTPFPYGSVHSTLTQLQREQREHDVGYHTDVHFLTVRARLVHFLMHFGKYNGDIARSLRSDDADRTAQRYVDTLLVCISCANTLHVNFYELIRDAIATEDNATDKADNFCVAVRERYRALQDSQAWIATYSDNVGQFATALEKYDHFEEGDVRSPLLNSIANLSLDAMAFLMSRNVDISQALRMRRQEVEHLIHQARGF